jgi:hypothetical protein
MHDLAEMGDNAGTEDPPVKLAINAVDGIKEKVKSFGQDETHDFVVNLKTDLEKLGKAQIIEVPTIPADAVIRYS